MEREVKLMGQHWNEAMLAAPLNFISSLSPLRLQQSIQKCFDWLRKSEAHNSLWELNYAWGRQPANNPIHEMNWWGPSFIHQQRKHFSFVDWIAGRGEKRAEINSIYSIRWWEWNGMISLFSPSALPSFSLCCLAWLAVPAHNPFL